MRLGKYCALQCADCNCVENKSKQSVNMLSAPLMVRSWRNARTWLSCVYFRKYSAIHSPTPKNRSKSFLKYKALATALLKCSKPKAVCQMDLNSFGAGRWAGFGGVVLCGCAGGQDCVQDSLKIEQYLFNHQS